MGEQVSVVSSVWENFFRNHKKDDDNLEKLLSEVPIFSQLTSRELRQVSGIVHRRQYSAGEYVFAQGDPGLGMYVIEEGEVSIMFFDDAGREKKLALLKSGDFFGDLSLLDESPRSAAAISKTESKIIGFFRPDLINLLSRSPKLGTKILFKLGEVIGTRLRVTNEQLAKLNAELEKIRNKK
ncbi:MAG TPA: cyclic nucleotide-binding domain-containing protein [Candidatus Acidoferrales bacterium]|nr:cyclic nucleotide-binding domain-containing protein [Candidatus Acidoferrales bacterium]